MTAADFTLPDHFGGTFRLRDALANAPVLLVFYRGHWCPYCKRYLSKLQANAQRLRALGVTLTAISSEPPATSAALARELGVTFPLLSDARGAVIDAYGARSSFATAGSLGVLPHAAVFVIDAGGTIRFRSIDRNFKRRTTMHTIFQEVGGLSTRHV